jgi:hypothetical protein
MMKNMLYRPHLVLSEIGVEKRKRVYTGAKYKLNILKIGKRYKGLRFIFDFLLLWSLDYLNIPNIPNQICVLKRIIYG